MILVYHRIASIAVDPYGMTVGPARFTEQMRILRERFRPVPLGDLAAAAGTDNAGDRVAITFDDGYVDNLTVASPILLEEDLPATFFLTTAGLAEPQEYWWDQTARVLLETDRLPSHFDVHGDGSRMLPVATAAERAVAHAVVDNALRFASLDARDRLRNRLLAWSGLDPIVREGHRRMTADEIGVLAARPGHAVGAHSVNHLWLPSQPSATRDFEIRDSKRALERLIDAPVEAFAYPFGASDAPTAGAIRAAGFTLGLTTQPGSVGHDADLFQLPRIEVRDEEAGAFVARLERISSRDAR